jgi:hypothetical protein
MKLAQTILYEQDVEQAAAFYQRVFELERGEVKRGHCVSRHRIKKVGGRRASASRCLGMILVRQLVADVAPLH